MVFMSRSQINKVEQFPVFETPDEEPFFSKNFTTTANIAAAGISVERFVSEEDEWEAAPFDQLFITNRDVVDIALFLDGNPENKIEIKAGFQVGATKQKFRSWVVKNLSDAAIHTAGKIDILVQNTRFKRRD